MSCNCKGKQEGNDLKFFKLLTEVAKEIETRPVNKVIKDMTVPTKAQAYRRLLQVIQNVNKLIGGKLTK